MSVWWPQKKTLVKDIVLMNNNTVKPSDAFILDFDQFVANRFNKLGIEDSASYGEFKPESEYSEDDYEDWLGKNLNWESTDESLSTRSNKFRRFGQGFLFQNEDGTTFQALVNWATNSSKRHGYLAPKGVGDTPYFPPISDSIRLKINQRFGLRADERVEYGDNFWGRFEEYPSLPLVVTEGAFKALALIQQGIPAVSLFGCYCGVEKTVVETEGKKATDYQLKETLKRFCSPGRRVILALDNDSKPEVKRKVAIAQNKLFQALKNHGCHPSIMRWSADFKGVDDLIVGDLNHFEVRFEDALFPQKKSSLTWMHEALLTSFGSRIRYNRLKNVIELDGEKLELDSPKCWWNSHFGVACSTDDITQTLLNYALRNQYHPVKNWLESLPPADSSLTLDNLSTYFLGTDNPIFDLYLKKTLIAAVARVFEPGCKCDTVLVLQGKQGIGKSTFLSSLAVNHEWFDDSLSASTSSEKDEKLKIHHSWILELAELEALFSRKEIASVRSLISSSTDVFRRPYARETVHFKRQSIFVGSVNPQHFLMDEEGNRRFLVIPVDRIQLPTPKQVEQMWKLALEAYKHGETWWLSRQEEQMQSALNRGFEAQDVWESAINNWLPHHPKPTTSQILTGAIELELSKQDKRAQSRITAIMKRLGYVSSRLRVDGERYYVWQRDTIRDTDGTPSNPVIEPVSNDFHQGIKNQRDGDGTPSNPVIEPVSDLRDCLSRQNSEKSTGISSKKQKELVSPPVISSSLANGLSSLPPEQKCTNSGHFGNDLTGQTGQIAETQSQQGFKGVPSPSRGNGTDGTGGTEITGADEREFSIYDPRIKFTLVSDPQTIYSGWLNKGTVYFLMKKRPGEVSRYYKVALAKVQQVK